MLCTTGCNSDSRNAFIPLFGPFINRPQQILPDLSHFSRSRFRNGTLATWVANSICFELDAKRNRFATLCEPERKNTLDEPRYCLPQLEQRRISGANSRPCQRARFGDELTCLNSVFKC